MKDSENQQWLDTKQVRKELKLSACDLSHIRDAGKLRFRKKGNAYLYAEDDVKSMRTKESL